jgi:DNA-binding transcriptional ArsR family regulator/16S rRNA G527 N7-methylase RsmG
MIFPLFWENMAEMTRDIPPAILFQAVSDPTRLRLLRLLGREELNVRELVRILGMSQPRISKHLAVLKDAGWLLQRKEGTWSWYRTVSGSVFGGGEGLFTSVLAAAERSERAAEDEAALAQVLAERDARSREFFAGAPERWDQIRKAYAHPDLQVGAVAALVGQRLQVIDIGTGAGALLPVLAQIAERVVAVDNSGPRLARASTLCEKSGLTNVRFHRADIQALPFADSSFDGAYCSMVLHHVARPAVAVAEMARVVRPLARVVITAFVRHSLTWMRDELAHQWLGFDREEMERLALQAGLEPCRYLVRRPTAEPIATASGSTPPRGRRLVWPDVFLLVTTKAGEMGDLDERKADLS